MITVEGVNAAGDKVTETVKTTVKPDGSYETKLPADTTIVDGSPLIGEAVSTDRNGNTVTGPDELAGAPGVKVPDDLDVTLPPENGGGLDLEPGSIDLTIGKDGSLTGVTEDVAPGTEVVITVEGVNAAGDKVTETVKTTVKPDGSYETKLPADTTIVDGSPLIGEAVSTDRNGNTVTGPDELAGAPGVKVPDDLDVTLPPENGGGLDLEPGSITVDIDDNDSTQITGTTTDVPPNSTVTLTIKTSIDDNGETREFTTTVETDNDGNYSYTLTPEQGNATEVVAQVTDRNGVQHEDTDQSDAVIKTDPTTDVDNGDNTVIGAAGDDLLAGDTGGLKTNFVAGTNYNVSIVLDLSGSMYFGMDGTRPTNPITGREDLSPTGVLPNGMLSRLEIAKAGLKAFIAQMADHDGVINLQISTFSSTGYVGNQSKWDKVFLDVTADNIDAIFEHIGSGKGGEGDGLTAGGGTNPELSFKEATDWFNSSAIKSNGYENQTYYITDGEPNTTQTTLDNAFKPLAEVSKVFAVGVSSSVSSDTVSRYDNTDVNGDKIAGTWNGNNNHGTAQAIADADKLIAYLIGGSENFIPADVGNDVVKGGAGDDILFGDAMNTDWITGLDPLQYPKYSGYSKLIAHLKATETGGAEPTQQEIYDFVKANYMEFVNTDAADPNTKGGNDIIYGGSGNDIIIAGAGDDRIYGGSGDDIISTGSGSDMIIYDVLNAADETGGNGTDTWVDYDVNDVIGFGADFFKGLLDDQSNIADYIKVEDVDGKAVLRVDRDGAAENGGTTHDWADLLIIEGRTASELQDLINEQIYIG
ncbi:MAG: type I secretion protein [Acinetobacter sp.]|uniref:type I secretion protein n=1 Tax=Acinetobacter sp. TaxID=472 RepID=UPI003D03D916